jgi:hypothetical protein
LKHPHFFVLGNHDYEVGADYLHSVHRIGPGEDAEPVGGLRKPHAMASLPVNRPNRTGVGGGWADSVQSAGVGGRKSGIISQRRDAYFQ